MRTLMTYVSPPDRCEYLPDRVSRIRHDLSMDISPDEYAGRLERGWRRIGSAVFRPECPACRMCRSLRVPVAAFRARRSQRRVWNANHPDVSLRIGSPSMSPARLDLWRKFHRSREEARGWTPSGTDVARFLVENPFPTEEWSYFVDGRLMGVGYVDALNIGLSAIYFFYDPDMHRRSPGTFNVLSILAEARRRGVPHVYLGYYVEGCRSLEYKARFRPNEVLGADGTWTPFHA